MFFLGDFIGDYFAIADTPTDVSNSTDVVLENGLYDELYIGLGDDVDKPVNTIPEGFGLNTIMHPTYSDSANGGNVDWSTHEIEYITIQRRKVGTKEWVVLDTKAVQDVNEFKFSGIDKTAAANTDYEYAVIPYQDGVQGSFTSAFIRSNFSGIYVLDADMIYGTPITDGAINTTRNTQRNFQTLLNRRYPVSCCNSIANYDTGECSGVFMGFNEQDCQFELDDNLRIPYQQAFKDWLTNGKPKIVKHQDGRIWLVEINPNPTDSAKDQYNMREMTFQWTEIGDANDNEDLWYNGFTNVPAYWWKGKQN